VFFWVNDLDLTTIIVNYNTENLLAGCIKALRDASTGIINKIIIVDNDSQDDSVALLKRDFSDCELVFNDENIGFGRANNQCLSSITGRYVLLLNTVAFVSPDTIEKTIQYMEENSACGILGVKLVGRDGELQPSCRYFPSSWSIFLKSTGLQRFFRKVQLVDEMDWPHNAPRKCDWVPGCYYLIRRELVDQIGLFDPRYFLYYEEVDHCFAAKKMGWEVHFYPDTTVVHLGGESAKSEGELTSSGKQLSGLQIESELLYFRKNYGFFIAFGHVLLLTLADMIGFLKKSIKLKGWGILQSYIKHSCLVWSLYFKTRLATVPTR